MNTTAQTAAAMHEVINSAKPGDKLKVVFANKTDEDMKGDLLSIFCMCLADREELSLPGGDMVILRDIAESGKWKGCHKYTFTILKDFDARQFASRTVYASVQRLESISKVG